jgi:hypothetical protein
MKFLRRVMMLTCSAVAALAGNDAPYRKEKVAEFVVEKLDVTTLPPAIRPKREKGKKTFGDYGYATRQVDEQEALAKAVPNGLLKSRESSKEFNSCPVISGTDDRDAAAASSYRQSRRRSRRLSGKFRRQNPGTICLPAG